MTGGTTQATHCEDMSGDIAFPPFSREDSVSASGIVETVPSRKPDHVGFVDPKLPVRPVFGLSPTRIRPISRFDGIHPATSLRMTSEVAVAGNYH